VTFNTAFWLLKFNETLNVFIRNNVQVCKYLVFFFYKWFEKGTSLILIPKKNNFIIAWMNFDAGEFNYWTNVVIGSCFSINTWIVKSNKSNKYYLYIISYTTQAIGTAEDNNRHFNALLSILFKDHIIIINQYKW